VEKGDAVILVVEDEPSIREIVSLYLRRAGFRVKVAADGEAALALLKRETPELVILDLMLPKVDGLEVTRWIRSRGDTPLIMLTAKRAETDRIAGLEMGADDYMVKPFSPQELVSRVRAVLRRSRDGTGGEPAQAALDYDWLSIDPAARLVHVRGRGVSLTVREFDLLWLLGRHPHQVFSRRQLLELVWGTGEFLDPSTVTVHVRRLREKIEQDPSAPRHIQTVWGVGYRFDP
jgi:DNA-binding response OmpR family regulator